MLVDIKYDIIMIGTSPISMIKLILEYKKNQKILILDKSSNWGGNWQVQKIYNYNNVEIAPHNIKIKENNFKIFDLLNIDYDINSFVPKCILPKPFLNITKVDRIYIPYLEKVKNEKVYYLKFIKCLYIIFLFIKLRFLHRNSPKFFYPKGGCSKLIKTLKDKLIQLGVKNILRINVLKIFTDKSGIVVIETNKGSFLAKKCIIPSGYKNIKFYKYRKEINCISTNKQKNCQIIIVVNEKPSKFPFYFNTLNNHKVKAINDVSHYSEYSKLNNNNERILAIRLSEVDFINEKNLTKNEIEDWLRSSKIIHLKSQIIYLKRINLPMDVRREEEISKLNKFSPKNIEFIYSFDMSIGLHYLKKQLEIIDFKTVI